MRILHVTQPTTHGTAHCVEALAAHQRSLGYEPVVAAPEGEMLTNLRRSGVPVHVWEADRGFGPKSRSEAQTLARIVSEVRPDAVHLHSSKASILGRFVVRGRRPTVVHPHAWSFYALSSKTAPLGRQLERWLSRWAELVLCTGSAELRDGADARIQARFQNIGNGVDTEKLRPVTTEERAQARKRLGLDPKARIALSVGRLCTQKAQVEFVDAWMHSTRHPDDLLVLVGDGPTKEEVRRRAGTSVLLLGERGDIRDLLAASDVYVQPSRWEGLAIGLLEAMAFDLPVVASDAGSTADALGNAGVLHEVGDFRGIARSTTEALAGVRPEPGVMRGRVVSRFSLDSWAQRTTVLVAQMADEGNERFNVGRRSRPAPRVLKTLAAVVHGMGTASSPSARVVRKPFSQPRPAGVYRPSALRPSTLDAPGPVVGLLS